MSPTSPRTRVRITIPPRWLTVNEGNVVPVLQVQRQPGAIGQKMPSAALASSDISSGDHGGRNTSSGRTSPMPSIGARNARI